MIDPFMVFVALSLVLIIRLNIVIRQKLRLMNKMRERLEMVRAADWSHEEKIAFLQKDGALLHELQPDIVSHILEAIQFWRPMESFYSDKFIKRIIEEK